MRIPDGYGYGYGTNIYPAGRVWGSYYPYLPAPLTSLLICRDVNGAGRVRVVAPLYSTRCINIRLIPILISVEYPLCGYPPIFSYSQVFTKLFKKQIFNHNFK